MKEYILNRLKEKKSLILGTLLVILYAAGELTGAQIAVVSSIAEAFGFDIPSFVDAALGALVVATPMPKGEEA